MSKRAYKTYTKEFKVEAIRLAEESDQPMTQVARKLGLRVNQIYKWRKQLEENRVMRGGPTNLHSRISGLPAPT